MSRIAFFGHDAGDAAVRRRVQGFRDDGIDVIGFTMRRGESMDTSWLNVDLGRTYDGAYAQRIRSIFSGARRAAAERDLLASAQLIYARNLDMLATAFLAKRYARLDTPVIYEALDIHRLLTRKDPIGLTFRRIEGMLLKRTRRLVVSSPGFIENYFERRHRGRYRAVIIENRLAAGAEYGPRPKRGSFTGHSPLRIGWVGVLRCRRSLGLLTRLARELGPAVRIVMHGKPALTEIPDFAAQVAALPNVTFNGPYRSPEDLSRIYAGIDLVWAGDFMEAGFNSQWLLPNRLYEGGYFGVPPIAPKGTQTGKWIEARGAGFTLDENLDVNLPALVKGLIEDPRPILARRERLLDLPAETFVARRGELADLIGDTLREAPVPHKPNLHQLRTPGTGKTPG